MMKKSLLIITALLVSSGWAQGSSPTPHVPQEAATIESIRQQYAATNKKIRRYRKVKKDLSGFSTEGGELVAYFDGPSITKMVANYYGESGKALEEYYYSDGKLIFVYRKDFNYTTHMSGKVGSTQESRFYFADDKLIRWLDDKSKQVPSSNSEYQTKQDEYLKNSKDLMDGARSKNSTIEATQ
jgi:outer membrane lipoprotein-sorting protein